MNELKSTSMLDIERLAIQSGILRVQYPTIALEKINDFQSKVRYGEMKVFGNLSGKMDQVNIERLYNFVELIINNTATDTK